VPWALPPPPPPAVVCRTHERAQLQARDGRPDAIGFVSSERYPLKVHWTTPGDDLQAADALAHAERAWEVQVDALGFQPPLLPDGLTGDDGGGPELDIYLDAIGEWEGYAEMESWEDTTGPDGFAASPAFVVIDRGLPAEWLAPYVVHEFNHVLQIAIDLEESSLALWEGTATAAQRWTLGDAGFWDADVDSYQEAPWAPALTGDSYVLWDAWNVGYAYEYGAALMVMHVDEVMGAGDGSAGPALWRAAAADSGDEPDAVDAFAEVSGEDLDVALSLLARTRWLTGTRWDARGLADAAGWGPDEAVPVAAHLTEGRADLESLFVHGQAFVTLDLAAGTSVAVEGEDVHWALAAFSDRDPAPFEVASGPGPELDLRAGSWVLALTNLGPPGFDGDDDPYVEAFPTVVIGDAPPDAATGCSCTTAATPPPPLLWAATLLLCVRRRRRSSRWCSPT